MKELARAAAEHGEPRFLHVCDPAYPCRPVGEAEGERVFVGARGRPWLALRNATQHDRYVFYAAVVLR